MRQLVLVLITKPSHQEIVTEVSDCMACEAVMTKVRTNSYGAQAVDIDVRHPKFGDDKCLRVIEGSFRYWKVHPDGATVCIIQDSAEKRALMRHLWARFGGYLCEDGSDGNWVFKRPPVLDLPPLDQFLSDLSGNVPDTVLPLLRASFEDSSSVEKFGRSFDRLRDSMGMSTFAADGIETVHRSRIEVGADEYDSVERLAFDLGAELDVEVEGFQGNLACSPYVVGEGDDLTSISRWSHGVREFMEKRKVSVLQF